VLPFAVLELYRGAYKALNYLDIFFSSH